MTAKVDLTMFTLWLNPHEFFLNPNPTTGLCWFYVRICWIICPYCTYRAHLHPFHTHPRVGFMSCTRTRRHTAGARNLTTQIGWSLPCHHQRCAVSVYSCHVDAPAAVHTASLLSGSQKFVCFQFQWPRRSIVHVWKRLQMLHEFLHKWGGMCVTVLPALMNQAYVPL